MNEDVFTDYLSFRGISISVVDLPTYIKGMTIKKLDQYIILINARFDIFQQRKTLKHEIAHIDLGHLELDNIADKSPELERQVKNYITQGINEK